MNSDQLEGKWKQLKGSVKEKWGKLTDDDLDVIGVIAHGRRRVLHFNVTAHPTSDWIVQQLRDALPLPCSYRYMLFDRDAKFGSDVLEFLKASDIRPIRASAQHPCAPQKNLCRSQPV